MLFKKLIFVLLALVMAAALVAFAACANDKNGEPADTAPAETQQAEVEPTEAAAEPTEQATPEPGPDYSLFDDAFNRFNAFIAEPNAANMRGVLPEDFFTSMKTLMDSTLEQAGIGYPDMGYEDFDSMLAQLITPEAFADALVRDDVGGSITGCEFTVKNAEQVDVGEVIAAMGDTAQYLNADKLTSAYKLTVDVTVTGEQGSAVEENKTVYAYEYDGVYYIAMFD